MTQRPIAPSAGAPDAPADSGAEQLDLTLTRANQRQLVAWVRQAAASRPGLRSVRLLVAGPEPTAAAIPDFDVLGPALLEARAVAAAAGLVVEIGEGAVPACVGFDAALPPHPHHAALPSWRHPPHHGPRSYGAPCRRCALRPACAGAWPATWDLRGGAGVTSPESLVEPWDPTPSPVLLQTTVRGFGADPGPGIAAASTPTVWLWTDRLAAPDLGAPFTHLALELPGLRLPLPTLERIRHVHRPVHVGLRLPPDPADLRSVLHILELLQVVTVALLAPETWTDAELSLRSSFPALDVRRIGPPLR